MATVTGTDVNEVASRSADRMLLVLALVLIAATAAIMLVFDVPAHGGSDENAYLVAGRQIAQTGSPMLKPVYYDSSPVPTFVGDMWIGLDLGTPQERYLPKYPPLFPLLVAAMLKLGGSGYGTELVYLLNPVGYCVGLLSVYLLARRLAGAGPAVAALAAAITAGPVLRMFSMPCSHGISFALTGMAAWWLVRWLDAAAWRHAIGAGALCALAAAARSGEIVLVLPLLVAAAIRCRRSRRDLLQGLTMLAAWGLVLGATLLLQYHWSGYWSLYAATGESSAFGLHYVVPHLAIVIEDLLLQGVGLFLPLGLIGVVLLARRDRAAGLTLATWIAANLLLYAAYYWAPHNGVVIYSRFFLPSVAPLCACGTAAIVWIIERRGMREMRGMRGMRGRRIALGLALWAAVLVSAWICVSQILGFYSLDGLGRISIQQRAQWLAERVPADAVVFADEMDVLDHLQFVADYTLYDRRMFRRDDLAVLVRFDPAYQGSLDPQRRRYLTDTLLSRSDDDLTTLRDDLIAAYQRAGRRVFIFSGPAHAWSPFDGLRQRGLSLAPVAQYQSPMMPLPTIVNRWSLEEVVAN